jgi:hypothetical protein
MIVIGESGVCSILAWQKNVMTLASTTAVARFTD